MRADDRNALQGFRQCARYPPVPSALRQAGARPVSAALNPRRVNFEPERVERLCKRQPFASRSIITAAQRLV